MFHWLLDMNVTVQLERLDSFVKKVKLLLQFTNIPYLTTINILDETLSDVSLSGRRSYIQLSPVDFDSYKFIIEFELRPLNDRGLILFIGKLEWSSFLSVSMQGAGLEIRVYLGKYCILL